MVTRTEFVGVKATPETKRYFEQLKKDTGKTPADVMEMIAQSQITEIDLEYLYKIQSLESQLKTNTRILSKLEKTIEFIHKQNITFMKKAEDSVEFVKKENEHIIKEIKKLNDKKPKNGRLATNPDDNIRTSVNSYLKTREGHINSFNVLSPSFDVEKVGRNICSYNNVDYSVFLLCIDAIDNNRFSLDDFNNVPLEVLGIPVKQ